MTTFERPEIRHSIALASVLAAVVFITGACEDLERRWSEASQLDTPASYAEFLNRFPASPHQRDAIERFVELSINGSLNLADPKSIDGLDSQLAVLSDSTQRRTAHEVLVSHLYDTLMSAQVHILLAALLDRYPGASKAGDARKLVISLRSQEVATAATLEEKERLEKEIIAEIERDGPGERLVLTDVTPNPNGASGQVLVTPTSEGHVLSTLYPNDRMTMRPDPSGFLRTAAPFGPGGLWRFAGPMLFLYDWEFDGSADDPLTFQFFSGLGFVYLHGSGTVRRDTVEYILPE